MAVKNQRAQFQDLFNTFWSVAATLDVANLVDGAGATSTFTVPGVALGDMVLAQSLSVDTAGITVTAWVSAANTVSVRYQNESAGTLDLASATQRILVGRPNANWFF